MISDGKIQITGTMWDYIGVGRYRDIIPIMENPMDKELDNELETGLAALRWSSCKRSTS